MINPKVSFKVFFWLLTPILLHAQDSLMTIGRGAYLEGDFPRAIEVFQELSKADSSNSAAWRFLGYSLQNVGRYKEAILPLKNVVEVTGGDRSGLLALARSYEMSGLPESAKETYSRAFKQDTTNSLVVYRFSQFLYDEKEWTSARDMLRRLSGPPSALVLLQLGMCEWNLGNTEDAASILQTAHVMEPENAQIVNNLSLLYVQMEMPESALKVLQRGIIYHPFDARFFKRMADIYFKQQDYQSAFASYSLAVSHGDSSAGALRSLGASQFMLNNLPGALDNLRRSWFLDATEALTQYYLGLVWQKLGRADSSVQSFQLAIALSRAKFISDALVQMSVSYEEQDSLSAAIASLKKAVGLTPEKSEILFYLASLYDRHYADRTVARKYYEEFIQQADPESPLVQTALGRVRILREIEHFRGK